MHTVAILLAAFFTGQVPADLTHATDPKGVLTFSDGQPLARMALNGHTPEWTPFSQSAADMTATGPDRFQGSIALPDPGRGKVTFDETARAEGGRVGVDWSLEFSEDSPLTGAYVSVFVPTERFGGAQARPLPGEATRGLPVEQGDPQLSGSGAGFAVACGDGLEFAVIGSAAGGILIQDNRRYGGSEFEVRFALVSGDVFAGQQASRSFTVLVAPRAAVDALVKEMHPTMHIDRSKPLAVLSHSGEASVVVGDQQLLSIQVAIHGVGWAYTTQGQGRFSDSGDSRSRTFAGTLAIPPDDAKSLEVREQARVLDDGTLGLRYGFRFPEGGRLNGYQVSFSVPISVYQGETIHLEGGQNRDLVIPSALGQGHMFNGSVSAVSVAAGKPIGFSLRADRPMSLLVQDNRGWGGDTIELRFLFPGSGQDATIEPGAASECAFTLAFDAGLQIVLNEDAVADVTDTSGWVPYTLPWDSCPVDVSFLSTEPAGAEGFVTCRDGHFVFADTGKPVRFWGTTFSAGANFPTHEQSEKIAERLKRFGVNIVRTHHADTDWGERSLIDKARNDSRHFDAENVDRFDYLIFCLKRAGIYIYLDQLVNRKFKPGDEITGYDAIAENRSAKPYSNFDPRLIELQKEFSKNLWTHVNPYTKLAYKDDPAIALMEFANENDVFTQAIVDEPFRSDLEKRYRAWAAEHNVELPAEKIDFTKWTDPMVRFLAEVQASFYDEMQRYLREEIGVKVPMTGSNWSRNAALLWALKDRPYTDSHTYWDHPRSDGTFGNRHQTSARSNTIGGLAFNSVVGKPFFVSEWDQPWPNEWRAEYPLLMASAAALQDWSGLTVYTYRHSSQVPIETLSGAFETFNDPARFGLFPTAALLFRRGDVDVAKETVVFAIPEDQALSAKSPGPWNVKALGEGLCEEHRVRMALGNEPQSAGRVVGLSDALMPADATNVRSDTGQLFRSWADGYGTIDTPRVQAVYGSPGGKGDLKLSNVTLNLETEFATVAVASLTDQPIGESTRLLLTAVGRAENTGMKYNALRRRVIDKGTGPILIEPIVGTVSLKTSVKGLTVRPILSDGTRAEPLKTTYENGVLSFRIGPEARTMYCEVTE
jgi:hypothetical protein